jgi:hypothetical protein
VLATARVQARGFIQGPGGGQHRTLPGMTGQLKNDRMTFDRAARLQACA